MVQYTTEKNKKTQTTIKVIFFQIKGMNENNKQWSQNIQGQFSRQSDEPETDVNYMMDRRFLVVIENALLDFLKTFKIDIPWKVPVMPA